MILWILSEILGAYSFILIVRMLLSWIPFISPRWSPRGIVYELVTLMYKVTDPPINYINRFISPVRFGSVGIDMGFLIVFAVIQVLQIILKIL